MAQQSTCIDLFNILSNIKDNDYYKKFVNCDLIIIDEFFKDIYYEYIINNIENNNKNNNKNNNSINGNLYFKQS